MKDEAESVIVDIVGIIPAVSQRPKLTVVPSTTTFALKLSNTVGI